MKRRSFLALSAGLPFVGTRIAAARQQAAGTPRMLQRNAYPVDAETPLDLLTDYLTPNDLFFVRHHWVPTKVDRASWALVVDGDVAKPLRLTLDDLRRMPRADATCVLQCAGNGRGLFSPPMAGVQWRYGACGNARWTGVKVSDLLKQAGVKPTAKHVHTAGADAPPGKVPPFHRSVEIEKLMADAVVAYDMNGEPLPDAHGGPARLVVPGWAGDHWMKWLVKLSPSESPESGFYMDTGYRYPTTPGAPGAPVPADQMKPVTELFVKSLITSVPGQARAGAPVTIKGVAFSGAPDIKTVEISDDGGKSWAAAQLDARHDPYAWRLWSYSWTPKTRGAATLVARATDSRGVVQPKDAVWNPSGYLHNGWHAVTIEVTA